MTPRRSAARHRIRAASGATTRTRTSTSRRCSRSPTAWAARRPASSPRGSPSRRSRLRAGRRGDDEAYVTELIQEANRRVYERATEDAAASGMGTTMTVALVDDGGRVTIGHVGDSRAYRIRDGELEQLTDDHSLVAELIRSGKLTPEEAELHPQRSVITRALGTDPDVDVDTFIVEPQPGDVFLLCSDGLTSDGRRRRRSSKSSSDNRGDLDAAAKELVAAANRGGGEDNITVVCFELDADEEAATRRMDGDRCRADGERAERRGHALGPRGGAGGRDDGA